MKDEYKSVFRAALGLNWLMVRAKGGHRIHLIKPGSSFQSAVCGFRPLPTYSHPATWRLVNESTLDDYEFGECQECVKWYQDNAG